jgi:CubicO group peptidase (beta-lactamase class C family)
MLIADNKLQCDDLVFGPGSLLGTTYGTRDYDPWELAITVGHLTDHTSGFSNVPYDIMFDDIRFSQAELIGKVLDERIPANKPGTNYEYSNFGYCLLGRIIEKVTGSSYEAYVKQELLYPMDISNMSIAGNTAAEAIQNEVSYYSSWFPPYQLNVNRMDSHGGWVASASDLARFAVHVDTHGGVPDIVQREEAMGYLQNGNWNHNGALPGTIAVLEVNYPFTFVVLLNRGETNFYEIIQAVRNFMYEKIYERQAWPKQDLFVNY